MFLTTKCIKRIEVISYKGEIFFRTKEVAEVLDVKQPFNFNFYIKEYAGEKKIWKGKRTADFRKPSDDYRTTFIRIQILCDFLQSEAFEHRLRYNQSKKAELLAELARYLSKRAGSHVI